MERPGTRCRELPRLDGQRWCRLCLTASQRDRRAARRAEVPARLAVSEGTAAATPAPRPLASRPLGAPEPHSALRAGPGEAVRTTHVPGPADAVTQAQALERYRRARAKLDRVTRETDWRRGRYSPPVVLAPLVDAVNRARAECQALGVTPDGAVTHALAASSRCPRATPPTREAGSPQCGS